MKRGYRNILLVFGIELILIISETITTWFFLDPKDAGIFAAIGFVVILLLFQLLGSAGLYFVIYSMGKEPCEQDYDDQTAGASASIMFCLFVCGLRMGVSSTLARHGKNIPFSILDPLVPVLFGLFAVDFVFHVAIHFYLIVKNTNDSYKQFVIDLETYMSMFHYL